MATNRCTQWRVACCMLQGVCCSLSAVGCKMPAACCKMHVAIDRWIGPHGQRVDREVHVAPLVVREVGGMAEDACQHSTPTKYARK